VVSWGPWFREADRGQQLWKLDFTESLSLVFFCFLSSFRYFAWLFQRECGASRMCKLDLALNGLLSSSRRKSPVPRMFPGWSFAPSWPSRRRDPWRTRRCFAGHTRRNCCRFVRSCIGTRQSRLRFSRWPKWERADAAAESIARVGSRLVIFQIIYVGSKYRTGFRAYHVLRSNFAQK